MKNIKKIILIILTCLVLCLTINLKADSGWDGDYDYDYGDTDFDFDFDFGDNDYSHNSSTHYTRRNSSSDDDLAVAFLVLGIFILLGIGMTVLLLAQTKNKSNNKTSSYNYGFDINVIKEILPDFDIQEFKQTTYKIYKTIQESWMNFNYDELSKHTTNELFNLYKSELNALKLKKQKNIMSDFDLQNFSIINMEKGENNISIKVKMTVSCLDYVVNKNDEVIRGSNSRKVIYNYEMTFTRGLDEKNNKCPNCNAPLDNVTTSVCPYCNSTVISSNHDWVLSKKRMISQRMK